MTRCIIHTLESTIVSESCPDCVMENLKVRIHAYDKALQEIGSASRFSIDGRDYCQPSYTAMQCSEIARLALSKDPEEFLRLMQNPPH